MNRIKCLRLYRSLSQAEFANLFNVDQTAVSNWEKGKNSIDIKIAEKIAEYFSVPMDFVYGRPFSVQNPQSKWYKDQIEDYYNCPNEIKDYLLFKWGNGIFHPVSEEEKPADIVGELTEREIALVLAYRNQPEMRIPVERLFGIFNEEYVKLYTAASSSDNRPDKIIQMPKEQWEKIKNTPDTDDTLL